MGGNGHSAAHEGGLHLDTLRAQIHRGKPLKTAKVGRHGWRHNIKVQRMQRLGYVDNAETGRGSRRVAADSAVAAIRTRGENDDVGCQLERLEGGMGAVKSAQGGARECDKVATTCSTVEEAHVIKLDNWFNVVLHEEKHMSAVISKKAKYGWLLGQAAAREDGIAGALHLAFTNAEAELGVGDVEGRNEGVYAVEVGVQVAWTGVGGLDSGDGDVAAAGCVTVYRGS